MLLAGIGTVAFTLAPALRIWKQDVLPWLKAGEQSVAPGSLASVERAGRPAARVLGGSADRCRDWRADRRRMMKSISASSLANLLIVAHQHGRQRAHARGASLADRSGARAPHAASPVRSRCRTFRIPVRREPVRALGSAPPAPASSMPSDPTTSRCSVFVWSAGRALELDDRSRPTPVAVVNQNLADALWPGQDAVGQTMRLVPNG